MKCSILTEVPREKDLGRRRRKSLRMSRVREAEDGMLDIAKDLRARQCWGRLL